MLNIRPEIAADLEGIHRVETLAFERAEEALLVDRLRAEGAFVLSLVAEVDGEMIGHLLFTDLVVKGDDGDFRGIGLGPVAIVPAFQNKGYGSQLIEAGLAQCRQQGHPFCIVLGHANYYPRFGFKPASTYQIASNFGSLPDDVFMAMPLQDAGLDGVSGIAHYHQAFY